MFTVSFAGLIIPYNAFTYVAALRCTPQTRFIFEVANGDNKVSGWKECLSTLMEKANKKFE